MSSHNHAGELFLGEVNGPEELIRVLNKVHLGSLDVVSIFVLSTGESSFGDSREGLEELPSFR